MFFCRARIFICLLGALSLCLEAYGAEPMRNRFSLVSAFRADVLFDNASDPVLCEIPGGASLFSAEGEISFSSWRFDWGAALFLSSPGEQLISVDEFLISRGVGTAEFSVGRTVNPSQASDPAHWLSGSLEPYDFFSPFLILSDRVELIRISDRTARCDFEAVVLPFSPQFASSAYSDPMFNRHGIESEVSVIDSTYRLNSIVYQTGTKFLTFDPALFVSAVFNAAPLNVTFTAFAGPDRTPARLFRYYRTDYLSNDFYLDERKESNSVIGAGLSLDVRQPDWSWRASSAWTGGRLLSTGRVVDIDGDWTETEEGQTVSFETSVSTFPNGRDSTELSLDVSYLCPLDYSVHSNLPSFTRLMKARVRQPVRSIASVFEFAWTQSLLDGGFIVCGSHELALFSGGVFMSSLVAPVGPLNTEFGQYRRSAGMCISFGFRFESPME